MLKECLLDIISGRPLTADQAEGALEEILNGADHHQAAAFFAALAARGETAIEIAGFIRAMRRHQVSVPLQGRLLDIVGTGGDGSHSVNISTGSAIVAAGCGARIAKHGNRAASSRCGAADVLEELGIVLDHSPQVSIKEAGIAFLFYQHYHPRIKTLSDLRKKLGIRTALNILGPLLNPASASRLLVGVYSPKILPLMAGALLELGVEHALVVHGQGFDEITPLGPCQIIEVTQEGLSEYEIDPLHFGISRCTADDLKGGDAPYNARLLTEALSGQEGAIANALALSAGAGLYVYGTARSIEDGVRLAQEALREGTPLKVLRKWKEVTNVDLS